jgi:hypothetical protein
MNDEAGNLTITPYFNFPTLVIQEKIHNFELVIARMIKL